MRTEEAKFKVFLEQTVTTRGYITVKEIDRNEAEKKVNKMLDNSSGNPTLEWKNIVDYDDWHVVDIEKI